MNTKTFNEEKYNKIAKLNNLNKKKIAFLKKKIGKHKKILEITGGNLLPFRGYYKENEIYLIDISREVLKNAKPFIKEGKIVNLVNEKLPYPDNYFDAVVAGEIIEHLFFPQNLIDKAHRVLKKGGLFLGSTLNAFNYRRRIETLPGIQINDPINHQHIRFFNHKFLNNLLKTKFKEIHITTNSKIKRPTSLMGGTFLWECKKGNTK